VNCLACDVLTGRIDPPGGTIYENEGWVVDQSISPVALRGWLIVKPRRHVENFGELRDAEAARFGSVSRSAAAAVQNALGAERVYVCSFGEEWRHVHFHVVPRYPGMEPMGWKLLGEMWSGSRKWACTDEEAAAAADAIRDAWT
jgi:diadenosine tetraphosphate (Ap4A) HIT family hydrolase